MLKKGVRWHFEDGQSNFCKEEAWIPPLSHAIPKKIETHDTWITRVCQLMASEWYNNSWLVSGITIL